MRYVKLVISISVLLYFICPSGLRAQQSYNSLFWEIAGKGLEKPSYLYGTIHIKDKRVFNLGDSVFIKLNECPAAALELDMDSVKQIAIKMGLEQSNNNGEEKDSLNRPVKYFSDEEEKIIKKGLARITGTPEDEIKLGNPSMVFFIINQFKYMKGDMPEVLDLRIYNMAKLKGKKLTGIETFKEQMNAFESAGEFDLKKAIIRELESIGSSDSSMARMVDAYCSQDLVSLNSLLKSGEEEFPDLYRNILDVRNVRMAERIGQMIKKDQTFIAIGAGHLYGEGGVISLLRKQGYSVRPILPTYSLGLGKEFVDFRSEDVFKKFTSEPGAFEVGFSNEPVYQERKMPIQGTNDTLSLCYWVSMDNTGYASYMVKYNDPGQGRFMVSDSAYLVRSLQGAIANSNGTLKYSRFMKFLGLPAMEYKINVMNNIVLKVRQFIRGNRDYALISSQAQYDSLTTERFFNTFRLREYAPVKWTSYPDPSGSFSIDLPVAAPQMSRETSLSRGALHANLYACSDPNSGQNYTVKEEVLSKYFHADNDSVLFEAGVKGLQHEADSVISNTALTYEGMQARDVLMKSEASRNLKRIRFILNGNKLFTLFTSVPEEMLHAEMTDHFYNSFKVKGGVKDTRELFTDKSEMILNDLASADTSVWRAAFSYILLNHYKAESLPHVYSLLKKPFPDDTADVCTRSRLMDILGDVNDSLTTADFISKLYPELPDNQLLKIRALLVLSIIKTDDALNKFKQLLLEQAPSGKDVYRIFHYLYGNTERMDKLFPDVLKMLEKDEYRQPVYSMISTRIDSLPRLKTMITDLSGKVKSDFIEFAAKHDSLAAAAEAMASDSTAAQDDEAETIDSSIYDDVLVDLMKIIPVLKKDAQTEKIITGLANDSSAFISIPAVIALLNINGNCESSIIDRLAKDLYSRNFLYDQMLKVKKDELFPAKYKTREALAESDMFTTVLSDYQAPSEIVMLDKKESEYEGEKGIFYLYKFRFENEPDKWYAGISGPQPLSSSEKPAAYGNATSSNYKLFNNDAEEHWKELLLR